MGGQNSISSGVNNTMEINLYRQKFCIALEENLACLLTLQAEVGKVTLGSVIALKHDIKALML